MTGPELRAMRTARYLSVPELSRLTGLSNSTLYNLEYDRPGTSRLHAETVRKVLEGYPELSAQDGFRLRQLRREKGYRLTDLQKKINVSACTIRYIETGVLTPNTGYFFKACMDFLTKAKPRPNLRLNGRVK